MRLTFSHIYLSCLVVIASMTGCVNDTDLGPCEEGEETMSLAFTLTVEPNSGSRSSRGDEGPTWGDGYTKDNVTYDDEIDINSVQVAIMDTDGNYVTTVSKMNCYEIASGVYQYYGQIEKDLFKSGKPYRCMIIANSDAIDFEKLSADNMPTYDITNILTSANSGSYTLPMWGVGTFTIQTGADTQDAGEIWMLKALSKCRVKLSQELIDKGYELGELTIAGYNEKGNVMPANYSAVGNTQSLSFDSETSPYCFNPVSSLNTGTIKMLEEKNADSNVSDGSQIGYFAEYANTKANPTSINVPISNSTNGTAASYTIEFKNYINNKLFSDLVRNHVYDFTITGFNNGLEVELVVSDWITDEEVWDFTDQISGDLTMNWTAGFETVNEEEKTVVLLSSSTSSIALEGEFTINSPKGATWFATLTTSDYFSFEFVDSDNNTHLDSSVTGEIDGKSKSKLTIRATNINNTQQHTCEITIYVRFKDGTSRKVDELSGWKIIQTR